MKERITKKDLGYWILILIGIIVTILTMKLGDNATAVDYIGFAGTITSILLAVVALMYSFYQNNAYESSTQQLEGSAKKIKKAVKDLDQVSEFKEIVNEMRDESLNISESIKGLQEVVSTIESGVHQVNNNLEDTRRDLFEKIGSQFSENTTDNDTDSSFTDIQELIAGLGRNAFHLLYLTYSMYENDTKIDRNQLVEFYVNDILAFKNGKPENINYLAYDGFIIGVLFIYTQLGFFKLKTPSNKEIEISKFNTVTGDAIQSRISNIMKSKDNKSQKIIEEIDTFVTKTI